MAPAVIPRTALLEVVTAVEVAAALIAAVIINHTQHTSRTNRINRTQAMAMASSPPTELRALHLTPAPLPNPATPSLSNRHGIPSTGSNILRKTRRTLLCLHRITTRIMPLKYTSNNQPTAASPRTNRPLNLPMARLIRPRARTMVPRLSSGELIHSNLRPTVHMAAAVDVAAVAATMIEGDQRGR
jgi:hypothetical protein